MALAGTLRPVAIQESFVRSKMSNLVLFIVIFKRRSCPQFIASPGPSFGSVQHPDRLTSLPRAWSTMDDVQMTTPRCLNAVD